MTGSLQLVPVLLAALAVFDAGLSRHRSPANPPCSTSTPQLLGGVLVITAPYLLGSLADHLGLHAAFTVEPVLIGACALLLVAGLRLGRHGHHP